MVRKTGITAAIFELAAVAFMLGLMMPTRPALAAGNAEPSESSPGMPTEEVADIRKTYCGDNPVLGEGCARDGFAVMSHMTERDGKPVRSWSLMGRKSGTIFTTECYCVIDE